MRHAINESEFFGVWVGGLGRKEREKKRAKPRPAFPEHAEKRCRSGKGGPELPYAASYFLFNPKVHRRFICGDPSLSHQKGMTYITGVVDKVDPETKTITFTGSIEPLTYEALIVATGMHTPLLAPKPGATLLERVEEVINVGRVFARADTVLVNGSGLIGLEIAGDIRANNPKARIVLLSREGGVLKQSHKNNTVVQARVERILKEKLRIELIAGTIAPPDDPLVPSLTSGTATIIKPDGSTEQISYDCYIPSFQQGPNTDFLTSSPSGTLDERGRIVVNEAYQSVQFPSLFSCAATSTRPVITNPASVRAVAVGMHAAESAKRYLKGEEPSPFKDTATPPPLVEPMNIKIGHGPNGYMIWVGMGPMDVPCCQPCNGGYPFCPPPCCWPLHPSMARCLGDCGAPAEGPASAHFMDFLLPKFGDMNGFVGLGHVPPPIALVMERAAKER
mmetsp:Transcript_16802/g.50879  ORF Transcript_16802/g.50879 Transcript_16802/m.50879 type:complete len:449 (+) Transcript_16802:106-1452(+)